MTEALRPDESDVERLDRNLTELLGELRVALPGIQVLFAFLLILPFQDRFEDVTDFQRAIYFATLICTALASICLIAPSARHRARFRKADKEYIVMSANRLALVGFVFLAVAMVGAIVLISDVIFGTTAALTAGAGVGAALAWLWFGSPLVRALNERAG